MIEKKLFIRHARGIKPTAIANDLARSIAPHLEQTIRLAKQSKNDMIRFRLAEIFVDTLLY